MWPNEQLDFTPWLVEHIDELGEIIGMDLEVVGREVSVGPYSADILAKDIGTNDYVVIENQLEKTNHDHLGKIITYASGLGAKVMVWIVKEAKEEGAEAMIIAAKRVMGSRRGYGLYALQHRLQAEYRCQDHQDKE